MKNAIIGMMILLLVTLGIYIYLKSEGGADPRRDHYLMPKVGGELHAQWVENYGDSADTWEMFTIGFHTKYMSQLNERVRVLEAAVLPEPNEPNEPETAITED